MLFRHMSKRLERIEEALGVLLYRTETIMPTIAEIQASQAAEDADIKTAITTLQGLQASNADLVAKVAALQAQVAAGSGVSAADLDALKADMDAQKAALDTALAPAAPAPTG